MNVELECFLALNQMYLIDGRWFILFIYLFFQIKQIYKNAQCLVELNEPMASRKMTIKKTSKYDQGPSIINKKIQINVIHLVGKLCRYHTTSLGNFSTRTDQSTRVVNHHYDYHVDDGWGQGWHFDLRLLSIGMYMCTCVLIIFFQVIFYSVVLFGEKYAGSFLS